MKRLERERKTVERMISIYCRDNHRGARLCPDCEELRKYAFARIEKCPFGENKPACSKCPVHCYKPELRDKIRKVMRYSGPRMIYRHPVLALFHLVNSRKPLPKLPGKIQ